MAGPEETRVKPEGPSGAVHHLGLVADTHGLFRPALEAVLQGVEVILHAGDVGAPEVLRRLRRVAPVVAVSGNVDESVPGFCLPAFEKVDFHGLRVLVTHLIGAPDYTLPPVAKMVASYQPDLVAHGHTHRVDFQRYHGVVYVNPGSCGPRRLDLPVTCAVLTIREGAPGNSVALTVCDLETGARVVTRCQVTGTQRIERHGMGDRG